ncbi:recombinase family protein [Pseudoalteromonas mariniglutinosa]
MSKKAYSYIRFSSDRQIQGNSLQRQNELLSQFLVNNPEFELQKSSYQDLGVSGFTGKHQNEGELGIFLKACENGSVTKGSYLLVESIDRLGRLKGTDFLSLIIRLFKYVTIITLEDNQEYSEDSFDGHAAFSLQAKIQQAHNYSKQLSHRLLKSRAATRLKVKEGNASKLTRNCPSWLSWCEAEKRFIEIPDRVDTVLRIFDLYINKGLGTTAIAKKLNLESVKSFNDKGWHGSYIAKILFDRKVIGEVASKDNEVFTDYYPKVVPLEVFLLAQQQKKVRTKKFRVRGIKASQPFDIYSEVVFCECGKPAKLYNKGNKKFVYQCKDRVRGLCVSSNSLDKSDLVFHFGNYLDFKLISHIRSKKSDWIKRDDNENSIDINSLKNERKILSSKIEYLTDLLCSCADEDEMRNYKEKIEGIRNDIAKVDLSIKNYEENKATNKLEETFLMTAIGDHSADWNSFICEDIHEYIVSHQHAINLSQWLKEMGVKVVLHSNYTYSLFTENNYFLMSLKKPHRTSRSTISRLKDNSLYIKIDEDNQVEFGDKYERAELMNRTTWKPIDPPVLV